MTYEGVTEGRDRKPLFLGKKERP